MRRSWLWGSGALVVLVALTGALGAGTAAADPPGTVAAAEATDDTSSTVVRHFYGDGCPFCAEQEPELDRWEAELDVVVHRYEVWNDADNRDLFTQLAAAYGVDADGVPATFIGDRVWIGYSPELRDQMRAALLACDPGACTDPLARLDTGVAAPATPEPDAQPATIRIPLVGVVELDSTGLIASTALIAFVDGFNPCSLWVLSILLALLLRTASRRRIAAVGATFLFVTAVVYGLFIAGVFGAMTYIGYLDWIRYAVAGLALVFGLVNIKDYFRFKQGLSFTIPDRFKPRIYRGGRGLISADRSLLAVLAATVTMALGVALVELPCTAGFPVVWSSLIADAGVAGAQFTGLLGLYLGVYLLDEIGLFAVVVVTMRVTRMQEQQGRVLKLLGGTIMLALAIVMALRPDVMHRLGGTLAVFAAAVLVTAALHTYERIRTRGATNP